MKKVKAKVHPEALESLKRYKGDVKAGHKDAAEYWRGQAGAYFTANPRIKTFWVKLSNGSDAIVDAQSPISAINKAEKLERKKGSSAAAVGVSQITGKKNPFAESLATGVGIGTGFAGAQYMLGKVLKKNPKQYGYNPRMRVVSNRKFTYRPCPTCGWPVSQYAIRCRGCGRPFR